MTTGEAPPEVALFGTDERVAPPRALRAGPLEATLDAGNLRYVRWRGREVLRAVAFVVRDRNWGTYAPEIANLEVRETDDGFSVGYDAVARGEGQAFRYRARIEGASAGSLRFAADGEALTDFVTNRTGFVVLHPLEGVCGRPVEIVRTGGGVERTGFPELVDPTCPFTDVREMAHEPVPGVTARCRMEGEAFETEDHRNWMDASYKTYVRPLAKPWPYTIPKGERLEQSVTLAVEETAVPAPAGVGSDAREAVEVRVGEVAVGRAPRLGLTLPAEHAAAALESAARLRELGPAFLVARFDARVGHGPETMRALTAVGEAVGAPLVLEAVPPCQDSAGRPTADEGVLARDTEAVAAAARAAGAVFERVAVSPACDLKSWPPGSVWPAAPSWEALAAAARQAFPGLPIGGGTFGYFTELNRKRPPRGLFDFIGHSGCPIVHAGDDATMLENLEALPWQVRTVRAFAGESTPYWIFPTAISMRDNPYGEVPAENPRNIRQAMNRVDPRERGLIGAAWYAGYLARMMPLGLDALTLAAAAGPSGVIAGGRTEPRPWFERGDAAAAVVPSWHVLRWAAGFPGGRVLAAESAEPAAVQALALSAGGRDGLLLANLTGAPRRVRVEGFPGGASSGRVLDAGSFARACREPSAFAGESRALPADGLELGAYAVALLELS